MVRVIILIIAIYILYKMGHLLLKGVIELIAVIYAFISTESKKREEKGQLYQKERAWEFNENNENNENNESLEVRGKLPSWVHSDQINNFNQGVYQILRSSGIEIEDAKRLLNHRNPYLRALYVAGRMEQKGATYEEQKRAAGETLVALWQRADHQLLFSDHLE